MATILIAEDEQPLLEAFAEIAKAMGHDALTAIDGDEALAVARRAKPDLIIADCMMPGRTGVELVRTLRTENGLAQVPVVLMSAGRPRGADEAWRFLAKPVELAVVEKAIREGLAANEGGMTRPHTGKPLNISPAALAREEMLNWVAHEIRSPLSAATIALGMVERQVLERVPESHGRFDMIRRQHARMNELVSSILDAARLEDGHLTLKLERFEIGGFIRELVDDWAAAHSELRIDVHVPDAPADVVMDPLRMRQIIDNLLTNAMKYAGTEQPVSLLVEAEAGDIVVRVRDRGPGIPAEQLPRIFDRFYRAEELAGRGHGLGLYIASAVARLHGGSLRAESEIGRGSTFTLRLPRAVKHQGDFTSGQLESGAYPIGRGTGGES